MWFVTDILEADSANKRYHDNWYPIHFACDANYLTTQQDIISGLLGGALRTDVRVLNCRTDGPFNYAPLMFLCDGSNRAPPTNARLVKMLVEARANMETVDQNNNTPFLKAASTGQTDVCRVLWRLGCNTDAVNERGANAANLAKGLGKPGCDTRHFLRELGQEPTEADVVQRRREGKGRINQAKALRYACTMDSSTPATMGGGKGWGKGRNK